MSQKIRLVIRIENNLYSECIAAALAAKDSFDVLISTGNDTSLIDEIRIRQPDILILDVGSPVTTMLDLVQQITLEMLGIKVIMIGLPETESTILRCIEVGTNGYVTKNATLEDLIGVIYAVCREETICSPRIAYSMFSRVAELSKGSRSRQIHEFMNLTPREGQIVQLIIDGLSNKRIAEDLCLSLYTVKNHVHSILKKLRLQSRTEMINYCLCRGLIKKDSDIEVAMK